MNLVLWILQGALALGFLFAGGTKLVLPTDLLAEQIGFTLPGLFVRFVGLAEVLGALGLILPLLLRIRPMLTPVAAAGLAVVMIGAAMFTPPDALATAAIPLGIGCLSAFVAWGRWRVVPTP